MNRSLALVTQCLLVLLLVSPSHASPPDFPPPTVKLEVGTLEGVPFGATGETFAFLGIPYAAPPVGGLRWKPPQAVRRWTGTRKASEYGASCPQLPARAWLPVLPWNEDCLYLNVWTPRLARSARLPVLVWVHGGSNVAGRGEATPLGPVLSRMGVVVVSANYRLGPLGFLAHPSLSAESEHHSSGNYGLLDQLQVLNWVRANISAFGGDPLQVTVAGQSAGAVDICLLMASSLAKGLFQRAILESGDCQGTLNKDIRTPIPYNLVFGTGESAGERLAQDLGVDMGRGGLRQLRSIPPDVILSAWSKDPEVHFDALVDGWVIPQQPAIIFAEDKQLQVPVLIGSNADEATVFGHNGVETLEQYKNYLREDIGKYSEEGFSAYPAGSDAAVPAQYLRYQNDSFAYGARSMARSMSHSGQKAYLYLFTYVERGKRAQLGAYHGQELKFLSDTFPSDWVQTEDDERVGKALRTYWIQFAKTGDPNAPGLPTWPRYEPSLDQYLEIGRTIGLRPAAAQLGDLEQIMRRVFADTTSGGER